MALVYLVSSFRPHVRALSVEHWEWRGRCGLGRVGAKGSCRPIALQLSPWVEVLRRAVSKNWASRSSGETSSFNAVAFWCQVEFSSARVIFGYLFFIHHVLFSRGTCVLIPPGRSGQRLSLNWTTWDENSRVSFESHVCQNAAGIRWVEPGGSCGFYNWLLEMLFPWILCTLGEEDLIVVKQQQRIYLWQISIVYIYGMQCDVFIYVYTLWKDAVISLSPYQLTFLWWEH
jgi:hypothetical protein